MQFYWATEYKRIALLSGERNFKLAREMYLFPLTQIAGGLSAVSLRATFHIEHTYMPVCVCEYSDFPIDSIRKDTIGHFTLFSKQ